MESWVSELGVCVELDWSTCQEPATCNLEFVDMYCQVEGLLFPCHVSNALPAVTWYVLGSVLGLGHCCTIPCATGPGGAARIRDASEAVSIYLIALLMWLRAYGQGQPLRISLLRRVSGETFAARRRFSTTLRAPRRATRASLILITA